MPSLTINLITPDMLPDAPTVWQAVGSALKTAAKATGKGTSWLVAAGYKNRHYLAPALNGAIGHRLAQWDHPLAIPMSLRRDGRDLPPTALAPSSTGHVGLFVHGLMADEVCFVEPLEGLEGPAPYLERTLSLEPLTVRFNSGRHISENGRELAALLEATVEQLGDSLQRLTLIGHSMGGLVVRSAVHYGREAGHGWPARVGDVVLLGTPNDGAWLEQVSHLATRVLRSIFNLHTRVIGRLIDERSDGIKDLRWGLLVDEDWDGTRGTQAQGLTGLRYRTAVPPLDHARYIIAGASLSKDASSLLATFFGDGQVGVPSAMGARTPSARRLQQRIVEGASHFGLLADEGLLEWVAESLGDDTDAPDS